jgi:hypothetical protein
MKHQAHFGTKSDIVSREAAQIRILIDDLVHTVDVLDAGVTADLPRADDAIDLDTRRYNLLVTIASLEDRLGSIENDAFKTHPACDFLWSEAEYDRGRNLRRACESALVSCAGSHQTFSAGDQLAPMLLASSFCENGTERGIRSISPYGGSLVRVAL